MPTLKKVNENEMSARDVAVYILCAVLMITGALIAAGFVMTIVMYASFTTPIFALIGARGCLLSGFIAIKFTPRGEGLYLLAGFLAAALCFMLPIFGAGLCVLLAAGVGASAGLSLLKTIDSKYITHRTSPP